MEWGRLVCRALRPGGHVFIATNAFICQLLYDALVDGGLEFRGEIIRLVRTLRGGDRPKNAEEEFPGVSSMPKGCYEPWGLFRKPMGDLKVSDCLRQYQTGGLRRYPDGPFEDVIPSERTPQRERGDCGPPQHQTAILPAPDRLRRAAFGRGRDCRSVHGVGVNHRRLRSHRRRKHRR